MSAPSSPTGPPPVPSPTAPTSLSPSSPAPSTPASASPRGSTRRSVRFPSRRSPMGYVPATTPPPTLGPSPASACSPHGPPSASSWPTATSAGNREGETRRPRLVIRTGRGRERRARPRCAARRGGGVGDGGESLAALVDGLAMQLGHPVLGDDGVHLVAGRGDDRPVSNHGTIRERMASPAAKVAVRHRKARASSESAGPATKSSWRSRSFARSSGPGQATGRRGADCPIWRSSVAEVATQVRQNEAECALRYRRRGERPSGRAGG